MITRDLTVNFVNHSVQEVLGYAPEEFVGTSIREYLHPDEADQVLNELAAGLDVTDGTVRTLELRIRHADGGWRYVEVTTNGSLGRLDGGDMAVYVRDITEHKAREKELARQALHDSLTGLANRNLFVDRLDRALTRAARRQMSVAVLFLDLDNFKAVNDGFGHHIGDWLLTTVGRRLQACLRPEDTAARLGGDEFAILLESVEDAGDAIRLTERVLRAMQTPVALDRHMLHVTASAGLALSAAHLDRVDKILRAADIAMYRAKTSGKSRYEVFEEGMSLEVIERLELEYDLGHAHTRGEFELHYQPIVSLHNRSVVGMEALLRWNHPKRGLLSPDAFLWLVKERGLMTSIGQWVLEEACSQARRWRQRYADAAPWVSVNVSVEQFQTPDLAERVGDILCKQGLTSDDLVLEVTENVVFEDSQHVVETLRKLRGAGITLAVDDFDERASLLSCFRTFPFGLFKMSRSLIQALDGDEGGAKIVASAVLSAARASGIEVVAKGVQTTAQLRELREMECDFAQGMLFSEPLSSSAARHFLSSNRGA